MLLRRCFSSVPTKNAAKLAVSSRPDTNKMCGWQMHSYGEIDEIQYSENIKIPSIKNSNQVLVRVNAASINPIDILLSGGYGSDLLNLVRMQALEFPMTLGRDFCGVIVQRGMNVGENLQIGQKVIGALAPSHDGCHSEYVALDASLVIDKPTNLTDIEAAGVLYAGLTAWSGLFLSGGLGGLNGAFSGSGGGKGKRICILGASGGVGHIATQIALAENAEIVTTSSPDAIPNIQNLGISRTIDYTDPNSDDQLVSYGPYDIILDCASKGPNYAEQVAWKFRNYVTFTSPLLRNIDNSGLVCGSVKNITQLLESNVKSLGRNGGLVKWAYFAPVPHAIEYLKKLVDQNKLIPTIDEVYDFKNALEAYKRVQRGHLRGKIILENTNFS